jgi:predicted nucleotide-binding protein (sugar kinase/HSP70/actin superfamily)
MPTAEGPCRFGLYSTLHKQVLEQADLGRIALLSPSSFNSYQGVEEAVRRRMWRGMLAGDQLFKAVCKTRPYEISPGETDRMAQEQLRRLEEVVERDGDIFKATEKAVKSLAAIPKRIRPKPLIGVVGEIYVRCDPFANENVIRSIESFGGEAWLAPLSEWILYTTAIQDQTFQDGSSNFIARWISGLKNQYIAQQEHKMVAAGDPYLNDRHEPDIHQVIELGKPYIPIEFEGEAILTIGRAISFARQGAVMVVNCAPFGCMPGNLTTAVFQELSTELKIPVVGMFYDGNSNLNHKLATYLNNTQRIKPETPVTPKKAPPVQKRPRV